MRQVNVTLQALPKWLKYTIALVLLVYVVTHLPDISLLRKQPRPNELEAKKDAEAGTIIIKKGDYQDKGTEKSPVKSESPSSYVKLNANSTGLITIEGADKFANLIQYCPDGWRKECSDDITVKRNGNTFQLDKHAVTAHQNAFNLRDSSGNWLKISDKDIILGENIEIINGKKESYFVYLGKVTP